VLLLLHLTTHRPLHKTPSPGPARTPTTASAVVTEIHSRDISGPFVGLAVTPPCILGNLKSYMSKKVKPECHQPESLLVYVKQRPLTNTCSAHTLYPGCPAISCGSHHSPGLWSESTSVLTQQLGL
jgi:hypothetical protein